jgi:hypothetical protein
MSSRARTALLSLVLIYPFWLAMMAVHELGHVVGAITTGGRVLQVSIPLAGFSETIVHPNPWPRVEVWCGPTLGVVIPVGLWLALRRTRAGAICHAFAGWCLIANGAYLGVGWIYRAGDAGELVQLGTPVFALVNFGTVSTAAGLFLWHLLGRTPGPASRDGNSFPAPQEKGR